MLLLGEADPSPAGAMHQLDVGQKRRRLGCTVVSTITLEKSAGLAAPVRVTTYRLSWIRATTSPRHALAPARHRRTVEHKGVPKELLAAE